MRQLPSRDVGVPGAAPDDGVDAIAGGGFDGFGDGFDGLRRPLPHRSGDLRAHVVGVVRAVGVMRIVGGAMAALVAVAVGWWLLRPPPVPLEDTLPMITLPGVTVSGASSDPSADGSVSDGSDGRVEGAGGDGTGSAGEVLVHVAGAVRRPGVYRLSSDARVADAVDRAGGASRRADLDGVNLAAPVTDGQQILVPRRGEVIAAMSDDTSSAPMGPVDLNRADVPALDALPGIGPATAAAIIGHRDEHGPFVTVDDLLDVPGIGPAKLDALRDLVTT